MTDTSTTPSPELDNDGRTVEPDGTDNQNQSTEDREAEIAELRAQLARIEADRDEGAKRRDTALTRAQQAEKRLKDIEAKERQAREAAALKDKDIESLRKLAEEKEQALQAERDSLRAELEAKLAERETEAKTLKAQLENSVKKAETLRVLAGICRQEENAAAAEVAYQQLQDSIELVEENGMLVPKPKGSALPLKDFAEKTLMTKGLSFLLAGQRKAGTGTQQQGTAAQAAAAKPMITLEELSRMPDGGRKYFMENPEAAKQFLERKSG